MSAHIRTQFVHSIQSILFEMSSTRERKSRIPVIWIVAPLYKDIRAEQPTPFLYYPSVEEQENLDDLMEPVFGVDWNTPNTHTISIIKYAMKRRNDDTSSSQKYCYAVGALSRDAHRAPYERYTQSEEWFNEFMQRCLDHDPYTVDVLDANPVKSVPFKNVHFNEQDWIEVRTENNKVKYIQPNWIAHRIVIDI